MHLTLLILGSGIYITLGLVHGLLTLLDLRAPRYFTPADDEIRRSMQGAPIRLSVHVDLWKSWLGFNLSHSLGLVLFGAAVCAFALLARDVYFSSLSLQAGTLAVSLLYVTLSAKYWFLGPTIGSGLATALFGAAFYL